MTDLSTVAVNDSFQDPKSTVQCQSFGVLWVLMNASVSASSSRVEEIQAGRGALPSAMGCQPRINIHFPC
jgi:hypothetical protein